MRIVNNRCTVLPIQLNEEVCIELLFFTILLWVSVFGIMDELISRLESKSNRIFIFIAIGVVSVTVVTVQKDLNFCMLQ